VPLKAPTLTALHFRIGPDDRRVLEDVARHERTTVSQLARKIVAEWIRAQAKRPQDKEL
jgi:hypothetical protein